MAVGDKIVTLDGLKAAHDYTQSQMNDMGLLTFTARYTERQGYIMTTTKKWGAVNANYTHVLIPVVAGDSVFIAAGGRDMNYALLTSDAAPVQGNDPPLSTAEGFTVNGTAVELPAQLQVKVDKTASFTVPTGVSYLLIYRKWNTTAYDGTNALKSLTINGVELATKSSVRLKTVEDKVAAMDVYVKPDSVYVDGSAAASGDGTSASPFLTIQEAVNSGAEVVRIKAMNGTTQIEYAPFSVLNRTKPLKIMPWEMGTYNSSAHQDACKILVMGVAGSHAVIVNGCPDLMMTDIHVKDSGRYGYQIQNVGHLNVTRCYGSTSVKHTEASEGNFSLFYLNNVNGVIRSCKAWNSMMDGFNIHGFGNTQFIDCVAYDNYDDGISHHDASTGAIIGGEYYGNGKAGVASPTYGANISIEGVYSHDNTQYGLYAVGQDGRVCSARVSNCVFKDNATKDLYINYADVTAWNVIYDTKAVNNGTFTERADVGKTGIGSPADLKRLVERGIAGDVLQVGQVIYVPWTDTRDGSVEYQVPMTVVHIGQATDGNNTVHDGAVYLQWTYAVPGTVLYGQDVSGQYNRYANCSLRTWLNGDFFAGYPAEWQAVFGTVHVKTAIANENFANEANPVLTYDETNDKVFLPSLVQMGGTPPATKYASLDEGAAFSYWLGKVGGTPTNNADDDRKVTSLTEQGTVKTAFLRTPSLASTVNSYIVSDTGALTGGAVSNASGRLICPVCVIY